MPVLLTGATGFVGPYIVDELQRRDEEVVLLVNRTQPVTPTDGVRTAAADICDVPALFGVMRRERIDRVIHLAALRTSACDRDPARAYRVNVAGTLHLLEAARVFGMQRFVYASSRAVYGVQSDLPIHEEQPLQPRNLYGTTKMICEQLGQAYRRMYGLEFVALRFPLVFGPARPPQPGGNKVSQMIEGALSRQPLRVVGGSQIQDPLYVKDAARGLVLAALTPQCPQAVYNLGSGLRVTLQEIADLICRYVPGAQIDVEPGYDPLLPTSGVLDISRAADDLGYRPEYGLEAALGDYLNFISSQG